MEFIENAAATLLEHQLAGLGAKNKIGYIAILSTVLGEKRSLSLRFPS